MAPKIWGPFLIQERSISAHLGEVARSAVGGEHSELFPGAQRNAYLNQVQSNSFIHFAKKGKPLTKSVKGNDLL